MYDYLKQIVLNSLIVLSFLNILTLFLVFYFSIKEPLIKKIYNKSYNTILPDITKYINGDFSIDYIKKQKYFKKKSNKNIIFNILIDYSSKNNINISEKFDLLGYTEKLSKDFDVNYNFTIIKKLMIIKSKLSIPFLLKYISSENFELRYLCSFALSYYPLNNIQLEIYIDNLVNFRIIPERIVEMIGNLKLNEEKTFYFIEKYDYKQKPLFIKSLLNNIESLSEEHEKILLNLLGISKDLTVSIIKVLSLTKKQKYASIIYELYKNKDDVDIKLEATKSMLNLNFPEVIDYLSDMMYDENWIIRFYASEILGKKDIDGINALFSLSMSDNSIVADMALYQINLSKNTFDTINKIFTEINGDT